MGFSKTVGVNIRFFWQEDIIGREVNMIQFNAKMEWVNE